MKKLLLVMLTVLCEHAFSQSQDILMLQNQLAEAKTTKEKFGIFDLICTYYIRTGNTDSQRFAAFKLLDLAKKEKDDSLLIRAYIMVNGYYWTLGNFPSSIEYSFKAINLAEKNGDILTAARTYSNVAWAYINLKNYTKAAQLSLKAIELAKKLKAGETYVMGASDNLAIAYLELGKTDSALYYTQIANSINLKLKDTYEQCSILDQFGRIYELQHDCDLAETYYRKAITLSISINEHVAASIPAIHYCRLLLNQNRLSEAKQFADLALREALAGKGKRQVIESAEILQLIYDKQNHTDSAYYFSKMVNVYRDSAFNEQQTHQVQNVTLNQQAYENEITEKKTEEEVTRKQNLQYAAIALGLITFIIFFFLFSQSIIANQKVIKYLGILALLLVFEFLNLLLHPFLERVTHHQPVLMLAALVCIAALLIPLHHKLEHWITNKMVEKNKKIRLAAAKKTIATLEGETN